jgi:Ion transport protein
MAEGATATILSSLRNAASEIPINRETVAKASAAAIMLETTSTTTTADQSSTHSFHPPLCTTAATAANTAHGPTNTTQPTTTTTTAGFCMKMLSGHKGKESGSSSSFSTSSRSVKKSHGCSIKNINSSKGKSSSAAAATGENNKSLLRAGVAAAAGPEKMDESESSSRTVTTARLHANDDTTTTGHYDNNREDEELKVVEVVKQNSVSVTGSSGGASCKNGGDAAAAAAADPDTGAIVAAGGSDDGIVPTNKNNDGGSNSTTKRTIRRGSSKKIRFMTRESFRKVNNVRLFCGGIVNNEYVQLGIIILIIINALMMGLATFDFVSDNAQVAHAFEIVDETFLIIFTVESGMQLLYHGWHLFQDAWLVFDLSIVLLSWSLHALQVVRAFRVFRAFRLVTRLTVLKNLILAIFAVAPSMASITALLILIMYVFAVLCTELFGTLFVDGVTDIDYFSTLHTSLFTLFQMMTLEDWAAIVRQIMEVNEWAWVVFSTYLVCTGFILYSLVIAVVCDAVAVTENDSKEEFKMARKLETSQRVLVLQKRVQQLASHQQAAMTAIQQALQELQQENNNNDKSDNNNARAILFPPICNVSSSRSLPSLHSMDDHDDGDFDYDDDNEIDAQEDSRDLHDDNKEKKNDDAVLSIVLETSGIDEEDIVRSPISTNEDVVPRCSNNDDNVDNEQTTSPPVGDGVAASAASLPRRNTAV